MHQGYMRLVQQIAAQKFLTEMDLLRLQKYLLMCRMSADSTALVDKAKPGYSSKLEELDQLFDRLFAEADRKVILFSEWTSMLDLIEPLLQARGLSFVRLDGSVPQKLRQGIVHKFQTDPDCRLFLATNAGSTGLNLQAANTVINVDLPWNPAVLEQRIARAYRMGQKQPVQVFVLITEKTIEENLLTTLAAKRALFLAALDVDSDVDQVDMQGGMEELRRRLEILLGARPEAPRDESLRMEREQEAAAVARAEQLPKVAQPEQAMNSAEPQPDNARRARREKLATTGGQLLTAALSFLDQLLPRHDNDAVSPSGTNPVEAALKQSLTDLVDYDNQGRPRLTFSLPDSSALDQFANTVVRLLGQARSNK
jgi:superfamily II DNA/RNA helicase